MVLGKARGHRPRLQDLAEAFCNTLDSGGQGTPWLEAPTLLVRISPAMRGSFPPSTVRQQQASDGRQQVWEVVPDVAREPQQPGVLFSEGAPTAALVFPPAALEPALPRPERAFPLVFFCV